MYIEIPSKANTLISNELLARGDVLTLLHPAAVVGESEQHWRKDLHRNKTKVILQELERKQYF